MPPPARLVGEFVDLRALTVDDAALTFGWRKSARAALLNPGAQTLGQQAQWIARRPSSEYNFVIERKDGVPLGMLALSAIDEVARVAEPGRFLIGDEAAARGLPAAAEAMRLLYQLAFDQLRLRRVWGIVAAGNTRMVKWQTYLGMSREGLLREHLFVDGQVQDAVVFGLLERDYRSHTLQRLDALVAAGRQRIEPRTDPEHP